MLRHRIILNFDAHAEGQTPETILSKIIPSVGAAVHRYTCLNRSSRPALLEHLERLTIQWQKSLPGLVGGHNTSRFAGLGPGVSGSSPFPPWRRPARRQLARVPAPGKAVSEDVPAGAAHSGAAAAGHQQIHGRPARSAKFDYARKLAAALCYVGLVRLDSICLQPFSDKLHDAFTASGGRHRFQPAMNFLAGLKPGGTNQFPGDRAPVHLQLSAARLGDRDFGFSGRRAIAKNRCSIWPISAMS